MECGWKLQWTKAYWRGWKISRGSFKPQTVWIFFWFNRKFKKFQCVEIDIEDEALAYEYFDAVNARGKELSISNLLRNLYLKNLSSEYRQSAQSEWDAIERKIEETKGAM